MITRKYSKGMIGYLLLSCALVAGSQVVAQTAETKPNIILILADDQGWNALSTPMDPEIPESGSSYFQTPNLDTMASQGMRFSRAYSGGPTCSPSRHAIQFGQTPASLGIAGYEKREDTVKADNQDSMINVLKQAHPDYIAAHFGKWHMMPTPDDLGFDVSDGETGNKQGNTKKKSDPKLIYSLTRKAEGFMDKQVKAGKPFFMQVSHYANHLKYQALAKTVKKYKQSTSKTKYHNDPLWAAMNDNLDESVGGILAKVKELGIEDNTYIIYTADNGYENKSDGKLPAHERGFYKAYPQRGHKYTLSEGGLRVPMIIRGPGIKPNSVCRTPVAGLDLLPTVLDFVGSVTKTPKSVEGGSLMPLLKGGAEVTRNMPGFVFRFSKSNRDVSIVQGDYKFLKNLDTKLIYLWNLTKDIGESNNLIKTMPEKASEMEKALDNYFKRYRVNLNKKSKKKKGRRNKSK